MLKQILLYLGAVLPLFWGVAHLFPTKSVVAGFGNTSADNQHIITMEWIVEGVALMFVGTLIALVTLIDPSALVSRAVYLTTAMALLVLAVVSLFTGFRVNFLPFKLCPLIFSLSALLILLGTFIL